MTDYRNIRALQVAKIVQAIAYLANRTDNTPIQKAMINGALPTARRIRSSLENFPHVSFAGAAASAESVVDMLGTLRTVDDMSGFFAGTLMEAFGHLRDSALSESPSFFMARDLEVENIVRTLAQISEARDAGVFAR